MGKHSKKYFFIILFAMSLACALPALPNSNPSVVNITVQTETVIVSSPTNAFTATFTFTPTFIQSTREVPQSTLTPTFTSTPEFFINLFTGTPTISNVTPDAVTMEVSVPTHCRVGPGKAYEIAGTLLVGEKAIVLGRDPSNKYWYIPNPDLNDNEYCWVWGEYATFTGSNLLVPMLTPLPTPTSTATAQPSLPISGAGRGSDKCNDQWWVKLEITNKSQLTLRSVSVEMLDTDNNVTRFSSSDGFIRRNGCNGYSQTETLEPNKSFVISGPMFSYNIHGHTMRVFITVCTEKDLKGVCNTIKVGANP